MSSSAEQAYAQIKNLENTGRLNLPQPQASVTVGTINALTGKFEWAVPTIDQTTSIPPPPGALKPVNTITNTTVGVVQTNAVDLLLRIMVSGEPKLPLGVAVAGRAEQILSDVKVAATQSASPVIVEGFPTVSSSASEIVVNAGFACSAALQGQTHVSPPVTTFSLTLKAPGHADVSVRLIIVRPPVLGLGAFTIPAVPIALVYAPPQGKQNKNSASYAVTDTFTRTVTTAVTSSTNTKTAQAYSAADLIGKVASSIAAVAAVVGTGGTGAGAAAGAGALGGILGGLFGSGGSSSSGSSTSTDLKTASSDLEAVADILNAVGTSTDTSAGTVTSESDHSLTIQVTNMSQYSTAAGQGPGIGDVFVYFYNVRVVWAAVNGEVGIHVLGLDTLAFATAADLLQDQQALKTGGVATTGLDATSIQMLLNLDPFCVRKPSTIAVEIGPALVGPPRFVPADPAERQGEGTTVTFSESIDVTSEDKEVQTTTQTNITDVKPSWVSVLFGGSNVETTTTMTFTTAQTTDTKTDFKVTNSVSLVSQDTTDPFDVLVFTDRTFGTYLYAAKGSYVLQGSAGGNRAFESVA